MTESPQVDQRFSGVLAGLLRDAGMNQKELAAAANVSRSFLSEIIHGKKAPSLAVAAALDRALDGHGTLTDLIVQGVTDDERGAIAAATEFPRRVSNDALAGLAAGLAAHRHLDDTLGSAAVLGVATAQMEIVTGLVIEVVGPLWKRKRVLSLAGQYAQFLGWLNTSVGNWSEASNWFRCALERAQEADDRDLVATALSYQGHVAALTGQPGPAVGLTLAALRDRDVHPSQRGYDLYQVARAFARVGEHTEADRLAAEADQVAGEALARDGDRPVWQYYRDDWMWQLESGLTRYTMGRFAEPGQARSRRLVRAGLDDLLAGLEQIPDGLRGADWAGEYVAHAAAAAMAAGELDQATGLIRQAGQIAAATRSPRVTRMVRDRERRLGQLRDLPAAA